MKKIKDNQLILISAGSNRQCFIDGALTGAAMVLGFASGLYIGAAAALVGGFFAANANGCFES